MLNFEDTEEEPLVSSQDSLMVLPFDHDIESMELFQPNGERATMTQPMNARMTTQDMSKNGRQTYQPKAEEFTTVMLTEEELNRIDRPNREQKSSFGKMSSFTIDSSNSNLDLKIIGKDEGLTRLL